MPIPGRMQGFGNPTGKSYEDKVADKIKGSKWPASFKMPVDMSKVDAAAVEEWAVKQAEYLLGIEDDVLKLYVTEQLQQGYINAKEMFLHLESFLTEHTMLFCEELWNILLCAQDADDGKGHLLEDANKKLAMHLNLQKMVKQFNPEASVPTKGMGGMEVYQGLNVQSEETPTRLGLFGQQERGAGAERKGRGHDQQQASMTPEMSREERMEEWRMAQVAREQQNRGDFNLDQREPWDGSVWRGGPRSSAMNVDGGSMGVDWRRSQRTDLPHQGESRSRSRDRDRDRKKKKKHKKRGGSDEEDEDVDEYGRERSRSRDRDRKKKKSRKHDSSDEDSDEDSDDSSHDRKRKKKKKKKKRRRNSSDSDDRGTGPQSELLRMATACHKGIVYK